jgi:hypothetical protein
MPHFGGALIGPACGRAWSCHSTSSLGTTHGGELVVDGSARTMARCRCDLATALEVKRSMCVEDQRLAQGEVPCRLGPPWPNAARLVFALPSLASSWMSLRYNQSRSRDGVRSRPGHCYYLPKFLAAGSGTLLHYSSAARISSSVLSGASLPQTLLNVLLQPPEPCTQMSSAAPVHSPNTTTPLLP